jgi:hypothetical protein
MIIVAETTTVQNHFKLSFWLKKTSQHSPKIRVATFPVQVSSFFPIFSYFFLCFPSNLQPFPCFCEATTSHKIQVDFQAYAAYQGIAEEDRAVDSEGDTAWGWGCHHFCSLTLWLCQNSY